MTVIATVITRYCTVHASDSFITEFKDGNQIIKESQQTKIVPVRHWRGAMSYWGLAKAESDINKWSVYDWLLKQANQANQFQSPEDFAKNLASELNKVIHKFRFKRETDSGIGIHFTAYEYLNGYWIPELFRISNYTDTSYSSIFSDGIHISRETYNTIMKIPSRPEHQEAKYRMAVHKYLHKENGMLVYNNGDPVMFNSIVQIVLESIREIVRRGNLADRDNIKTYRAIALMPIKSVSDIQREFARQGARLIGGKPHNLAITPQGEYSSDTGDC